MPLRPTPLALLASAALSFLCPGFAGAPYTGIDAGDVFIATVTRVEDAGASNANPPKVWLEVHQVLRGKAETKRSPALWFPPFHGIDYGDDTQPELKRWEATPLKGPAVGAKFILGGQFLAVAEGNDQFGDYELFPFVRMIYSEENHQRTIAELERLDEARKKEIARRRATKNERAARKRAWRDELDPVTIDRWTRKSDAVAVGKLVSSDTFHIERMLKGRRRMLSGGEYYLTLPSDRFAPRIADIITSDRPRCVLFLSEEQVIASVTSAHADLVDPYHGVVLADGAAIAAVETSLRRHPPAPPRPVLVISQLDRADLSSIVSAARPHFEVVISHQFSAHGTNTIDHVRDRIPFASALVMVGRGATPKVRAVRIGESGSTLLYESTWSAANRKAEISALIESLTLEPDRESPARAEAAD